MNKGQFALSIVWLISLFLVVSVLLFPSQFFSNGTTVIGWIFFALSYTFNHSDWFYMKWYRIKFSFINPDCIWHMKLKLINSFDLQVLDRLEQSLIEKFKEDNIKITPLSLSRRQYKIGTLTFEVKINEDLKNTVVSIFDMEVSYKRSNSLLNGKLSEILDEIRKLCTPSEEQYSVRVEFQKFNPYFGLFIKKLKTKDIDHFKLSFHIEQNNVSVHKNSIEINSANYDNLLRTTKSYLTLSQKI